MYIYMRNQQFIKHATSLTLVKLVLLPLTT